MKKLSISIAVLALALVGVTGCAPTTSDSGSGAGGETSDTDDRYGSEDSGGSADTTGIASLTTAESELGTIVVDDRGLTVYVFDQDTQGSGSSSCSGACLSNWPPVTAGEAPALDGVTGDVDTITATDGSTQVTLNGWPLYYYAGDSAAGDTAGQGVNEVWWVVGANGEKITG